jgi:hypothetical protein
MSIRIEKLTAADGKDLYLSEGELEINKYLKTIAKKYSEDSLKNVENIFQKIGKEAEKLLKEVETQKIVMEKALSYWRQDLKLSVDSLNRRFSKDKKVFQFELTLKKCYAFIQQVRKAFSGETLEYLILFDESLSGSKGSVKESKIGRFTLKDLMPSISLSINQNEKDILNFGLRINKQDSLKRLYEKADNGDEEFNKVSKQIIDNFMEIINRRLIKYNIFKNKAKLAKSEKAKEKLRELASKYYTNRGFGFEEATLAIVRGWKDAELLYRYKQDTEAFWRGGDLKWAANEIPKALIQNRERINLELKRVSATAKNSIGAGLVSVNGISTALITIKNVLLNKKLQKEEMTEILNRILFKAKKNISMDTAEKIANLSIKEINKVFSKLK